MQTRTEKKIEAGVITFVDLTRRFGFIEADDGGRVHFSATVCRIPWDQTLQSRRVEFTRAIGERGPFAVVVLPAN